MRFSAALLLTGAVAVLAQFNDTVNVQISELSPMTSGQFDDSKRWYWDVVGTRFNLDASYGDDCPDTPGEIQMYRGAHRNGTVQLDESKPNGKHERMSFYRDKYLTVIDFDLGFHVAQLDAKCDIGVYSASVDIPVKTQA